MLAIAVLSSSCHKDDDKPTEQKIDNPEDIDTGDKEYIGDGIIDNMSDEQRLPIRCQFAVASILYNLAGLVDVPANFAQNTYEPVYGSVISGSSPSVRTVVVETADDAEDDFCSLVGSQAELLQTTPDGLALSIKNVQASDGSTIDLGTLTFHRGSGGNALGYVEVDIPCIPHLERIDYIPPTALPENAGANTPYLLGDIVLVTADHYAPEKQPGYYLCVKPNNETAGVLVNLTAEDGAHNKYYVNADDDEYGCWFPFNKNAGEYVQKSDVEAYVNFIAQNPDKVKKIKDFLNGKGASAYQPTLANRVAEIFPICFAEDGTDVVYSSLDKKKPAAIRYNASCSWLWRTTYWYEIPHNCTEGWNVSQGKSFEYYYNGTYKEHRRDFFNFCINVIHFGTKEIHGAMKEFSPINDKFITKEEEESMIDFITADKVGWCYADNNRIYKTADDAIAAKHKPLGIVAYVSNDGTGYGEQITDSRGHGLVMAYKNATKDTIRWNPDGKPVMELDPDDAYTQYVTDLETARYDFDAISKMDFMDVNDSKAPSAAINYKPKAPKYSQWFVPTTAQWMAILGERGLGRLNSKNFGWDNGAVLEPDGQRSTSLGSINDYLLTSAGSSVEYDAFDDATGYMSCSAADATANYILLFNANDTITAKLQPVDSVFNAAHVRPVFAF